MDRGFRHTVLEEENLMSSVRTLMALKGLLTKAIGLIDAELGKSEGKLGPCPHTDYTELPTRRGPQQVMCDKCGKQFSITEEDEHEQRPETMGRRRLGG